MFKGLKNAMRKVINIASAPPPPGTVIVRKASGTSGHGPQPGDVVHTRRFAHGSVPPEKNDWRKGAMKECFTWAGEVAKWREEAKKIEDAHAANVSTVNSIVQDVQAAIYNETVEWLRNLPQMGGRFAWLHTCDNAGRPQNLPVIVVEAPHSRDAEGKVTAVCVYVAMIGEDGRVTYLPSIQPQRPFMHDWVLNAAKSLRPAA